MNRHRVGVQRAVGDAPIMGNFVARIAANTALSLAVGIIENLRVDALANDAGHERLPALTVSSLSQAIRRSYPPVPRKTRNVRNGRMLECSGR